MLNKMQFFIYSLLGSIGMLSDFAIFYVIVELDVNYQIAHAIGYAAGTAISFRLQRRITFRVQDRVLFRLILFFVVAGTGYASAAVMLWFFVELSGFNILYSKLMTLPIVALLQYLLNRNITFSK
tara:strand:- start:384 stop:758 length:375 start_codon:yes stop_codon:yes gene_type:complete